MADGPDLSKVVSMIMENPSLVAQISEMARGMPSESTPESTEPNETAPAVAEAPSRPRSSSNRSRLLGAMKPYLSKERGRAIDTMISIVEILEMTKGGK